MATWKSGAWDAVEGDRQYTSHLRPLADLVEHTVDVDCVCGLRAEPVPSDDMGGLGWVYVHASLDGREFAEGSVRG